MTGDAREEADGPGREHAFRAALRWRDIDVMGHVHQGVYHQLLDEVRAVVFAPMTGRLGFPFVLAHVHLDHRAEVLRSAGHLDVTARVVRIGTTSVAIEHEIRRPDGRVAAEGRSVMVAWDRETRGPRPVTGEERRHLES